MVLLAKFTLSSDVLATKILDFKNLSSDAGLYVNDTTGLLDFNGGRRMAVGGTPVVTSNYVQIVLQRDSSDATTVYENGVEQFEFADTGGLAILGDASPSPSEFLTFFKDDATGLGGDVVDETTLGDIARIRLYDGP